MNLLARARGPRGPHALKRALRPAQLVPSTSPTTLENLKALYDAEIYFNDLHFGELVSALKEAGIYEGSVIVVVSDHGEEHLRDAHQHHRLGFADAEIEQYCEQAGLTGQMQVDQLIGDPLTVKFWLASR